MSDELVIDHKREGDKHNWALDNTQILSNRQNVMKAQCKTPFPDGTQDGKSWYRENYPLRALLYEHESEMPDDESWIPYRTKWFEDEEYHLPQPDDLDFSSWAHFGFTIDGDIVNFDRNKRLKGAKTSGRRYVNEAGSADTRLRMEVSRLVAYLWRSRKRTSKPFSMLLVVDHINGDTLDDRAVNLQLITNDQNLWRALDRNLAQAASDLARAIQTEAAAAAAAAAVVVVAAVVVAPVIAPVAVVAAVAAAAAAAAFVYVAAPPPPSSPTAGAEAMEEGDEEEQRGGGKGDGDNTRPGTKRPYDSDTPVVIAVAVVAICVARAGPGAIQQVHALLSAAQSFEEMARGSSNKRSRTLE